MSVNLMLQKLSDRYTIFRTHAIAMRVIGILFCNLAYLSNFAFSLYQAWLVLLYKA